MRHLLPVAVVLFLPGVALAQNTAVSGPITTTTDNTTGCTALAQAAAAGMAAQITADDQSIRSCPRAWCRRSLRDQQPPR